MTADTHDLFGLAIGLHDDGSIRAEQDRRQPDADGWTVGAVRVEDFDDTHPDLWEMHPEADELVGVLAGGVRLYLRPEHGEDPEAPMAVTTGRFVLVPRGRWHRIEIDGPTELMSITRRRGTGLDHR